MAIEHASKSDDFAEFLEEFSNGSLNEAASKRLREVIAACRETGNKGSMTLKISIEVKGEIAQIGVKVSATKPDRSLPGAFYYTDETGKLFTEDPKQLKLPSKVIDVVQGVRVIGKD